MPAYRLLPGVVAPIVAVAVAVNDNDHVNDNVNDHVNDNGTTVRAEAPFEPNRMRRSVWC
jgi:hypothetical protein